MIKVGVADFGMFVWDGGLFDYEQRCKDVKAIGYDGLERLRPISADDAINMAAKVHKLGMDFGTCLAPTPELSIQWTAAFGKTYVWTNVTGKDFETFCRQVNIQAEACKRWGIKVVLHNHLGTVVETQEQLLKFLEACPECGLILDTGHLGAADGGNSLEIIDRYFERIVAVHVKDWMEVNPDAEKPWERGYFCELGAGNFPINNDKIVQALIEKGYDGWIFVEHDGHLREPLEDLKVSRDYLYKVGI